MTAQTPEILIYEGQRHALCDLPLDDYFARERVQPDFRFTSTALWRGYVGTWEIVDGRLYLIELEGQLRGGSEVSLETFFPHARDRVFADWYSGTLRVPQGRMLDYEHVAFASVYERDLLIEIEQGVVQRTTVRQNGTAESGAGAEGYRIAGMTMFGRKDRDSE